MAAEKLVPRLEDGSKSYYKRVESFLDGQENAEGGDSRLFLENVVKQVISDDAVRVCCDKDGSRAIERLLQHHATDVTTVHALLEALATSCRELAINRCGSHVMEALVKAAASQLSQSQADSDDALQTSFEDGFMSMCIQVRDKVHEFIVQPYASHVLSSLVQVLGGVYFTDHASRSRSSKEFRKAKMAEDPIHQGLLRIDKVIQTPSTFLKQLDSIVKRICKIETFNELLTHQCACPVLQTVLRVLSQRIPDRANKLIRKITKYSMVFQKKGGEVLPQSVLPSLFTDPVGSHLMECMIQVASSEVRQHIFDSCFKSRAMNFALHPVANYPLQQLISSVTPEQVGVFNISTISCVDMIALRI